MKLLLFTICIISALFARSQSIMDINAAELNKGDFVNFQELKNDLKKVRIVGLGESSHTTGTTFLGKVAMIKYLHDSLGFNTIAMESGIFDLHYVNEINKKKVFDSISFTNALWSFWNSAELNSLNHYIFRSHFTENPLKIIGMDNQMLRNSKYHLKREIEVLLDSIDVLISEPNLIRDRIHENFFEILAQSIRYSNYYSKIKVEDTTTFSSDLRKIRQTIKNNQLDTNDYFSFWGQVLENIRIDATRRYHPHQNPDMRDSMMYENIDYYLNQEPNNKVIIWSASTHLFYNNSFVNNKGYHFENTGSMLKKKYDEEYYFIAFVANGGRTGKKERGLLSLKIKKTTEKSIEKFIENKNDVNFALMSMRNPENIKIIDDNNINCSKMFWVKEVEMTLYKVCDAIFYIKTMHPPKYDSSK